MSEAAAATGQRARVPADAPPLIRLRGVTKVYGEGALAFQALKGVDLDIAQGDFVAIMRPSSPACSGVTWAIEGICALGTMRKCTGAQGWMSWNAKISSSS